MSFLKHWWLTIKRRLANGLLLLAASTTLLVWAALLLVAVLICSLLMTLTRSRMSRRTPVWLSTRRGHGSKRAPCSA